MSCASCPAASKVDHREIALLVQEIDGTENKLSKGEINFIAELIDGKVTEFTAEQAKRVRAIHENKVVNGRLDND